MECCYCKGTAVSDTRLFFQPDVDASIAAIAAVLFTYFSARRRPQWNRVRPLLRWCWLDSCCCFSAQIVMMTMRKAKTKGTESGGIWRWRRRRLLFISKKETKRMKLLFFFFCWNGVGRWCTIAPLPLKWNIAQMNKQKQRLNEEEEERNWWC